MTHSEWLTHAKTRCEQLKNELNKELAVLQTWQKIETCTIDLHQSFANKKLATLKYNIIQMRDTETYINVLQEISNLETEGYTAQTNWWGVGTIRASAFNTRERKVLTYLRDIAKLSFNMQRLLALNVSSRVTQNVAAQN